MNYDPETHVMDLQADLRKLEGKLNRTSQELYAAELEVKRLRAVIQEVVDDDESREDGTGWGPDVTMLLKLKTVLEDKSEMNAARPAGKWQDVPDKKPRIALQLAERPATQRGADEPLAAPPDQEGQ